MEVQKNTFEVIILGGGISGLTCSFYLGDTPHLILERTGRLGGAIRSLQLNGGILECGPNFLLLRKNEAKDIVHELGLDHDIIPTDKKSGLRFVLLPQGLIALTPLSLSKHLFLKSPFTLWKFMVGGCTWKRARPGESVYEFFTRKFSKYFAKNFSIPMVSGIYGGDAKKILVNLAFPLFARWDKTFNSFWPASFFHLLKKAKHKIPSGLYSFRTGLEEMVHHLEMKSHGRIQKNEEVLSLDYIDKLWRVTTSHGVYFSKKLVSTLSPSVMSPLLKEIQPELSSLFSHIPSPWLSVAFLSYKKQQLKTDPQGFGFLNSLVQEKNFLGCFYSSSMFPERFSPDETVFTLFIGGSMRQDLKKLSSELLIQDLHRELSSLFGIEGEAAWSHVHSVDKAIPQYDENVQNLREYLSEKKIFDQTLFFASNCQLGVSIPDCMINAKEIAKKINGGLRG